MNVMIFWVRAMECACAKTRPRFILSSKRVKWGDGVRTPINSKGKTPSTGKNSPQRRIAPTALHQAWQRAQHTTENQLDRDKDTEAGPKPQRISRTEIETLKQDWRYWGSAGQRDSEAGLKLQRISQRATLKHDWRYWLSSWHRDRDTEAGSKIHVIRWTEKY